MLCNKYDFLSTTIGWFKRRIGKTILCVIVLVNVDVLVNVILVNFDYDVVVVDVVLVKGSILNVIIECNILFTNWLKTLHLRSIIMRMYGKLFVSLHI